jgi:hypothetical protein
MAVIILVYFNGDKGETGFYWAKTRAPIREATKKPKGYDISLSCECDLRATQMSSTPPTKATRKNSASMRVSTRRIPLRIIKTAHNTTVITIVKHAKTVPMDANILVRTPFLSIASP